MNRDPLDLLAEGFCLSCTIPNITLVVVCDELSKVCGIDSWWDFQAQETILTALLNRHHAIPIGFLCLDENLDPVALHPLKEWQEDAVATAILLGAYEAKTGRPKEDWYRWVS